MPQLATLSGGAARILRVLRERAMDGYTLMSRTSLQGEEFEKALNELIKLSLVNVKGEAYGPAIGEAYLWVPPDAKRYADFLLSNLS